MPAPVVVLTPNLCGRDGISRLARLVDRHVRRGDRAGAARTGVGDALRARRRARRGRAGLAVRGGRGRAARVAADRQHPRDRHPPASGAGGAGVRGARRVADHHAVRRRGVEAGEPAAARGARSRRAADRDSRSSRATASSRPTRALPAARSTSAISASSRCRTAGGAGRSRRRRSSSAAWRRDERYKGHDALLEIWARGRAPPSRVRRCGSSATATIGRGSSEKAASLALGDRGDVPRPARRRGAPARVRSGARHS